jgi:cell division protein FtsW
MKKIIIDYKILTATGLLIIFGLFVLAGVASVREETDFFKQIYLGIIPGALVAFAFFKTPVHIIKKAAPYLFFLNLIVLLIIISPFLSYTAGGSTRWFSLGPISFQPSEFLKLTFILYISSLLASRNLQEKKMKESFKKILLPFVTVCGILAFLFYKQPDLSTFIIILSTGFIVYFAAKTPLWHNAVLAFFGGAVVLFFLTTLPYILNRVLGIIDTEVNLEGINYQSRQALIAIGSGGTNGLGFGMSQQKFGFLPEAPGDSIFAIIAEETGFIGATLVVLLFLFFAFRAFLVANRSEDKFCRFLAIGIGSWIFIQSSVNIGVMLNLLPVTGMPLPFISYGKSHIVSEIIAVGILLNVSQYAKKDNKKKYEKRKKN